MTKHTTPNGTPISPERLYLNQQAGRYLGDTLSASRIVVDLGIQIQELQRKQREAIGEAGRAAIIVNQLRITTDEALKYLPQHVESWPAWPHSDAIEQFVRKTIEGARFQTYGDSAYINGQVIGRDEGGLLVRVPLEGKTREESGFSTGTTVTVIVS